MGVTDAIKVATEPASKLIEAVSKAIGKAYEPRYIRKMADAKAYEMRVISEELRNNCDLPIVYNGNETLVDISDYDRLRQRTGARLAYQEIRKQENIEAIVDKAIDEVQTKGIQSDDEINLDWMTRFLNDVGEIGNEEMQKIWASVLAGECIKPRSYSLKTLDCLRNLTAEDAKLFSRVCSIVINDRFLINDLSLNEKYGVDYDDILKLDECGLINSGALIELSTTLDKENKIIIDLNQYVIVGRYEGGGERVLKIKEFPLSQAGRELLSVARRNEMTEQYKYDIADCIRNMNHNCIITMHKVEFRDSKEIGYNNKTVEQ